MNAATYRKLAQAKRMLESACASLLNAIDFEVTSAADRRDLVAIVQDAGKALDRAKKLQDLHA